MDAPDLVDQMQWLEKEQQLDSVRKTVQVVFNEMPDDNARMALCMEFMIEGICRSIDKFPVYWQRQILVIVAHKYLSEWGQDDE